MIGTMDALESRCKGIVQDSRSLLDWQWDDYTHAMMAVFPTDRADAVLQVLQTHLPACWDASNLTGAPVAVRRLADALGGVREGQMLFVSPAHEPILLWAAWWPWGDGASISVRVGLWAQARNDADAAELRAQLTSWFDA